MIHFRKEGEQRRQGFNVYPLSDRGSAGFVLLIWRWAWWLRYSKGLRRFFCQVRHI